MHFQDRFSLTLICQWILVPLLTLYFSAATAQQPISQTPPTGATVGMAIPAIGTAHGGPVLVRSPDGTTVNRNDVLSELRRAPESDRQAILSKPEQLRKIASNLLVRRILAAEAERDVATDPVLAAALAVAHDRVLSDAYLTRLDAQNSPSDAVIDAYARNVYQANSARFEKPAQVHARHILLCKCGVDSLPKAKALLAQLREGASFEDLAKANSLDEGSAAKGGDLGFFGVGKMVKPFDDALNKLNKPGELSEPVESQFGYHIIRLEERQEKSLIPYPEVRSQLINEARKALIGEKRTQKAEQLTSAFVFENAALEVKPKAQ